MAQITFQVIFQQIPKSVYMIPFQRKFQIRRYKYNGTIWVHLPQMLGQKNAIFLSYHNIQKKNIKLSGVCI